MNQKGSILNFLLLKRNEELEARLKKAQARIKELEKAREMPKRKTAAELRRFTVESIVFMLAECPDVPKQLRRRKRRTGRG